ncbi:MAG: NAD(+)/NADH kinase [Acidimicrobiales bacterium]|uniref:NAD kinase n=1 Tax=uncultured actinobacterium HF0200_20K23 TaxID=711001 RepID=E0XUF4_9ACTN|nr:predicted sugar kinase [uncultured actinobacterium HF0200_20K23]MCH2635802.1 NAD(+)/NADH kinase [Acidimicrobiales bacterium]
MSVISMMVHPERSESLELAAALAGYLEKSGNKVRLDEVGASAVGRSELGCSTEDFAADADLAVSIGGDGTMLRTFERVAQAGVPVLGVNVGHLGYLTEFEADEAQTAVDKALRGDLPVEERLMIQSRVQRSDGEIEGTWIGLNEAVVEKKSQGHTVRLEVTIDDSPFATYAGDGLIVSTPTGSTAYNLSARGSIVAPTHWSLQLTPVAPHMLFDRSLVLRPDTEIRISVVGEREANLSVDGRSVAALRDGDVMIATRSEVIARLVTSGSGGFQQVLKQKFGLKDR